MSQKSMTEGVLNILAVKEMISVWSDKCDS